jgi:hypothetical protein
MPPDAQHPTLPMKNCVSAWKKGPLLRGDLRTEGSPWLVAVNQHASGSRQPTNSMVSVEPGLFPKHQTPSISKRSNH